MSRRTAVNAQSEPQLSWRHSLGGKLLIFFLMLSLVPLVGTSIFAYMRSEAVMRARTIETLSGNVILTQSAIESWMTERIEDVHWLSHSEPLRTSDPAKMEATVKGLFEGSAYYESIFVTDVQGQTIYMTDGSSYNVADREYFQAAIAGESVISDVILSRSTGEPVFVVAVPIYRQNSDTEIIGILGAAVRINRLGEIAMSIREGESGETYVINKEGYFITPSRFTDELIADGYIRERAVLEMHVDSIGSDAVLAGESGSQEYPDYRGVSVLGSYAPIDVGGVQWGLLSEIDSSEAFAESLRLRTQFIAVVMFSAFAIAVIAIWLSRNISRPLNMLSRAASRLAAGDTDQEISHHGKDEVGLLADEFRRMIDYQQAMAQTASRIADGDLKINVVAKSDRDLLGNAFSLMVTQLRSFVGTVQSSAQSVSETSKELAFVTDQAGQATGEIAHTINGVAEGNGQQSANMERIRQALREQTQAIDSMSKGATQQAQAVNEAKQLLDIDMTKAVRSVATLATENAKVTSEVAGAADDGNSAVEQTIQGMQSIAKATEQVSARVSEMSNRSEEIGQIVQSIDEIAERTNLLALNAAIEAARAGEHGKGFAVVADEVRKLAEQAGRSAQEITLLVQAVQETARQASNAMESGKSEVTQGIKLTEEAQSGLQRIVTATGKARNQLAQLSNSVTSLEGTNDALQLAMTSVAAVVEENTALSEQLAGSSQSVLQSIEEMAAISEETSASAEQVAASAEEVSAQVEETVASVETLAQMAADLSAIAAEFRLDLPDATARTSPDISMIQVSATPHTAVSRMRQQPKVTVG